MKKLILKTALITLGATTVALVAIFGLMSLWAPATMMKFTFSLGLDSISGDYAYQEYQRSGELSYLARSFIVSANAKDDKKAEKRFELLYADEEFESFCNEQDAIQLTEGVKINYRSYLCAEAVRVKYRLSAESDWEGICQFAIKETDPSFPIGNPVVALATEAIADKNSKFCEVLIPYVVDAEKDFDKETADYRYILKFLNELLEGAYPSD